MKRFSILAVVSLLALALVMPATVAASSHRSALLTDIPVTGTLESGGTFEGLLSITDVALNSAGELVVGGVLNGVATPTVGDPIQLVDEAFTAVADLTNPGGGKCDILQLNIGPIDLDLLGLVINLSAIDLNVDAVPGPGNLLGNLLCAVAGLLDGGPLAGLNNLLNRITSILG
jgi:hypothetical protein